MPGSAGPGQRKTVLTVAAVLLIAGALLAANLLRSSPEQLTAPQAAPQPTAPTSAAAPTAAPGPAAPVPPGVPAPQVVVPGLVLERTRAWLRRGLADATTFRVGTFNVLGDSHTSGAGNKARYASGTVRMNLAYSMIVEADLDLVGFQELEAPQYDRFRQLGGSAWDAFPGPTLDRGSIRDSIAWRTDTWELLEATSVSVPYFGGQPIRRPVVHLQNLDSGRKIWVFNTHNPADTPRFGNNARWRAAAVTQQIALADELGADGDPVVFTGDYNDRAEVFCPFVGETDLESSTGGSNDGTCSPPERMGVDWIFGSGITWSGSVTQVAGVVNRVSDHPFVYADATVPQDKVPPSRRD